MRVDKEILRATMLALEADQLEASRANYAEYLSTARLDRTESRDAQDFSQALQSGHYAQAFDAPIHAHEDAIAQIKSLDFGVVDTAGPGAVVRWEGQNFVIAALTGEFECQGQSFMGISCDAPITSAMFGKAAGDSFDAAGMTHIIEDVY